MRPCILWTGATNGREYPQVRKSGRLMQVTRLVLEERLGRPLRPGMLACHTCDTPRCIEPEHLWEGSMQENILDARDKGRLTPSPGESNGQAKLTREQVEWIRQFCRPGRRGQHGGEFSVLAVSRRFGVAQSTVHRVLTGEGWR